MLQHGDDKSGEAILSAGVLCASSDLHGQSAFEALRQLFEPRFQQSPKKCVKLFCDRQKSDESMQMAHQQECGLKVREGEAG